MTINEERTKLKFPIAIQVSIADKNVIIGSLDTLDANLELHGWFNFSPWSAKIGAAQLRLGSKILALTDVRNYRRDLESINPALKECGFSLSAHKSILEASNSEEKLNIFFVSNEGKVCTQIDLSSALNSLNSVKRPVRPLSLATLKNSQDNFYALHLHTYSKTLSQYIENIFEKQGFDVAISAAYYLLLDRTVDGGGYISNLGSIEVDNGWPDLVNRVLFSEEGQSNLGLMSRNLAIIDSKA